MVHRREGIIIVNICGTLMCQEVLFPWHFCASLPLSLITTLRSIRLSAPLRSRENFGTPRQITQLISEGARMEAGLLALSYHALPPPYESTISITDKTWRLFLLMQHAFPIICEMEKKLQARFLMRWPCIPILCLPPDNTISWCLRRGAFCLIHPTWKEYSRAFMIMLQPLLPALCTQA